MKGSFQRVFRRKPKTRRRKLVERLLTLVIALFVSISFAPELLAWPYKTERGGTTVYSETPIPAQIIAVLAKSDVLLAESPIHDPELRRRLFLSDGGWRWHLLA